MTALAERSFSAQLLQGDRLHLQDGPIDLVIEAEGPPGEVHLAYAQAVAAFSNRAENTGDLLVDRLLVDAADSSLCDVF